MTQLCGLDHEHGHGWLLTCYHQGKCRCEPCKDNLNRRERERRKEKGYGRYKGGRIDPTGTRRRVQGLQFLGWTVQDIADTAGLSRKAITWVQSHYWVEPETEQRIREATDVLLRRGRGNSTITASRAKAKGWVSVYAWDSIDDDPEPPKTENVRATFDDLVEEIEGLKEAGESAEQIVKAVNRDVYYLERALWKAGRGELASFFYHARKRAAA